MANSNDTHPTMSDMFRGERKGRLDLVHRNFDRWYGSTPAGDCCEICLAAFEPGADFLIGRTLPVGDMQVCSVRCAIDALGGPEPTKPEPPVPTRELARDAWKRLGGYAAPEQPRDQWPATDALLELLRKHPFGTAPADEWQYVYRLLHPTALNAECDDLLRQGGLRGVWAAE